MKLFMKKEMAEKKKVEAEAKLGFGGRFGAGLPASSDGQMLFLQTAISKMKDISQGGSRIAIIHSGSPLFTGDAGSGPSDIRKYILENDLLKRMFSESNLKIITWILHADIPDQINMEYKYSKFGSAAGKNKPRNVAKLHF